MVSQQIFPQTSIKLFICKCIDQNHAYKLIYFYIKTEMMTNKSLSKVGCRNKYNKDGCLLGFCAMQSGRNVPTFRMFLLPSSSGQ